MNFTKAFAVFMQIDSKEFTEDEKYEAIQQVLDAATINSITKKQVLNVVSWLFNKQQKYRWHDLRKNPDDLPDVPHPERTWFEVVQEDNEDCIPRATMQYDDEYGFGFYQEIYAARSFGYVDTEFKTVEELNLAPVVAWKAIERIKTASEMSLEYYKQPLICTYSGGKDSDVLLELFKRSGVPFEVQHSHTTADAPQTVWHVRDNFKKLEEGGDKVQY